MRALWRRCCVRNPNAAARHAVSRQSVYVALSPEQKALVNELADCLAGDLGRADISQYGRHVGAVGSVAPGCFGSEQEDAERDCPGIGLFVVGCAFAAPWPMAVGTSIRLSPQQVIQLGRAQGLLHALFNANRSEVFSLGLGLLNILLKSDSFPLASVASLTAFEDEITRIYL